MKKIFFIKINDKEIKNFYKLNNFKGEFNQEMKNEIKNKEINLYVVFFLIF